ncbi:MAG: hypothetical protein KAJ98_09725 [Spirochaetaceae bacterium]|nr:hypothetical protein [Spirochaetaceae bacterium]
MTIYRRNRLFFHRLVILISLTLTLVQTVGAQTGDNESGKSISRTYRGISLGMSPDAVKDLLSQDSWFNYRGEADVSLLERPRGSLIDAGGSLFISRGLFQFEEEALSAIMLELNPETIDWFTVYTTLEERYGTPVDLNPSKAWWEDGSTRLALERPLTVKYLDLGVFEAAQAAESDRIAWREQAREEFLDEF